jgi:GPH family glycoside/pentoside/hexuronide:cation symporter
VPTEDQIAPLPVHVRAGWGVGSMVTSTLVFVTTTFSLRFLTDYVGLAAGLVGLILASTKIFDALVNPLMGLVTDRTGGVGSRRRKFLMIGAGLGVVSLLGLFYFPTGLHAPAAAAYALGMLLLSSLAFTVFNVPYLSMPVEMTPHTAERASMMSFRIYAMSGSQLLASGLGPLALALGGGGRSSYGAMAAVLSAVVFGAGLITFLTSRRAPFTRLSTPMRARFWSAMPTLFRSRLYVTVLLLKLSFLTGSTAHTATAAYYVHHVMRATDGTLSLFLLTYAGGMIASTPLWLRITRRIGRSRAFIGAASLYMVVSLAWMALGAGGHLPTALFLALSVLNGAGSGGIVLAAESMLPEAMADDFRLSGIRREGMLVSVCSFTEKFALALGLALVGLVLNLYGYVTPKPGHGVEGEALRGVMVAFGLLPAIFVGGSSLWLFILRGYRPAEPGPGVFIPVIDEDLERVV